MDDFTDRSQFRIGDLLVIPGRLIVLRDGQKIKFEPRWMEVLVMLAEHAGETLSTERLLIEVWGSTVYGDSPVSKTISYIRKSISDDSRKPRYVETVSKVGYRLIAPVSLPEDYRRMPSERWTKGSPYVGLSAFGADHASVFCGRSRIVADLLRAMRVQIENQRRFVLIVGASGCGKTSLLRAGAIPLLTKPDGFDGLRAVSVTTCDLAANGSDPLIPLTAALAAWTLGTRPVFPPQTAEQLKALLTETPDMIEGFVSEAFRRHSERDLAEQPYTHLLLTVDHAEALVATTDVDADARDAFARVLQALCACPHVMVTMIARGDFYLKLIEALPALAELKAGDGHLDVMAPRYGEIGEIIRSPAWKADLSFETDPETRTRLDDALRDAALSQPDALPLLQHTLQTLYERRNDQRQLTFAAYNDIGGLEGAIAHRAEEVFATLPANAQASLDNVLAKLIVIQPDSDAVSARRAEIDVFNTNTRVLIEIFIAARLFVGDRQNGHATIGIVHEALLRRWPRAVEWTKDNRRLLQVKARLQHAAKRWNDEGRRDDHLLNPGRPLGEAQEISRYLSEKTDDQSVTFLSASERFFKRKKRIRQWVGASLVALSFFSSASAFLAIRAESETRKTLESLVKQADAFRAVSELVFRNANMRGAEHAFVTAVGTLQSAHENNPESEEILFQYAISSYWLGYLYLHDGNLPKAKAQWFNYLKSCLKLVDLSPQNTSWRKELSYAYNNIGNIDLRERNTESALKNFRLSLAIKRRLLTESKPDHALTVEYADTLSWIGSTEESIALPKSALARYAEQIRLLRGHVLTPDATDDHRRQLANALWRSSRLSAAIGDTKTAQTHIRESVLQFERLVDSNKNDDALRKDLANANFEAFRIYSSLKSSDEAGRGLESAVRAIQSIQMNSESPQAWIRLRETIRFHDAMLSKSQTRENIMQNAISNLEILHKNHPKQAQIALDIANARIARGIAHAKMNRHRQAIEDWREAAKCIEPFAIASKDHTILRPWISANELLGNDSLIQRQKRLLIAAGYGDWSY